MHEPWTVQLGSAPQQTARAGEINLALGQPSPRLLPLTALAESAARVLGEHGDRLLLQYGAVRGPMPVRQALAEFLTQRFGVSVRADELVISPGNSGALGLVCDVLPRPSKTVYVEDSTYVFAAHILRSHGLHPVGIPVDEQGMQVDALAHRFATQPRPAFVYCIPAFHNPTGVTLSDARRRQLLELAANYDVPVVADEPYNLLHFGPHAPLPLAATQPSSHAISLGSFSKILAPGLRLGWIHAGSRWLDLIVGHGVLRSGGGFNPVGAALAHDMITRGFLAEHIDGLRHTLEQRARALVQTLARVLPELKVVGPDGGYFVWPELPARLDSQALLQAAQRFDLRFYPGPACSIDGHHAHRLRLSFAFYEPHELVIGVERLGQAVHDLEATSTDQVPE